MRPTRWGAAWLAALGLCLAGALSSGNNLLYFLFGLMAALFVLAALMGRLNAANLSIHAGLPERVFAGEPFRLAFVLRRPSRFDAHQLRVVCGPQALAVDRLAASGEVRWSPEHVFPHRGLNRVVGLRVESLYPLGLFRHAVEAGGEGLAFPPLGERRDLSGVDVAGEEGPALPRPGSGGEFHGVREHSPSDGLKRVNWKVSAKTGRVMVNEFAQPSGRRAVLRCGLEEQEIRDAASACRFLIDSGAEVNLVTPEGETGFGRGLLHLDRMLKALALLGAGRSPRDAGTPPPPAAPAFGTGRHALALYYAVAGLLLAAFLLVDEIPAAWLPVAAAAWLAGLALDRRPALRPPPFVFRTASFLMLAYTVLFGWRWFGISASTAHLVLFLLVHGLLAEKTPVRLAESFRIGFLALFLVTTLTISPGYPLVLTAFALLSTAWLSAALDSPSSRPAAFSWLGGLAALLTGALALGALIFALMPRVEARGFVSSFDPGRLDPGRLKTGAVTGFTENVDLGFFGDLKKSSARVMRVRVEGGREGAPLYVRGSAFDFFDGTRWSKSSRDFQYELEGRRHRTDEGKAWLGWRKGRVVLPSRPQEGAPIMAEFTLSPLPTAVVFTLGAPLALSAQIPAYFDFTGTLYFPNLSNEGRRYTEAFEAGEPGFRRSIIGYDRFLRGPFLEVPRPDERMKSLAERITRRSKDALDRARAVEGYLRSRYEYELFSKGPETLDGFLFGSRRGNCEYFATAGAVLLRYVGVPTRLVTGFMTTEWNEDAKFYDVRQSDAHAWLEAYVPERGWVTLDPTPPGTFVPAGLLSAGRRLARLMDGLELLWYRDVIGFDAEGQRELMRGAGAALSALGLTAAAAALAWAALRLFWGFAGRLGRVRGRVRPEAHFYLSALGLLERSGLVRETWETGREFTERVLSERPSFTPLAPLTDYHYLASYAARELGPEDRRDVDRLLRELREAVRA